MSTQLRNNCYIRIKSTGHVGKLNGIYRRSREERGPRVLYGVDWANEYQWNELERISPKEYHATPAHLKLGKDNPWHDPKYDKSSQYISGWLRSI